MILRRLLLFFFITWFHISTIWAQEHTNPYQLELDHFVFFVNDTSLESLLKTTLNEATLLATEHKNQGTFGKYFLFYNTYIELLYLKDSAKAKLNEERFGSPYLERWKSTDIGHWGFGFNLVPFDTSLLNFEYSKYSSIDSPPDEYYVMPDFNQISTLPFAYISLPNRKYNQFESLDEIDEKVEEFKRKDLKHYLSHNSGIKKLTAVRLQFPKSDIKGNIELLNQSSIVEIMEGEPQIELTFDEGIQGKTLKFQGAFSLIIKY